MTTLKITLLLLLIALTFVSSLAMYVILLEASEMHNSESECISLLISEGVLRSDIQAFNGTCS